MHTFEHNKNSSMALVINDFVCSTRITFLTIINLFNNPYHNEGHKVKYFREFSWKHRNIANNRKYFFCFKISKIWTQLSEPLFYDIYFQLTSSYSQSFCVRFKQTKYRLLHYSCRHILSLTYEARQACMTSFIGYSNRYPVISFIGWKIRDKMTGN